MSTTEWSGTPAEWDAERERKIKRVRAIINANFVEPVSEGNLLAIVEATMPTRPVEPPSVRVQDRVCVTYDGSRFVTTYAGCARAVYDDEAQLAFKVRLTREELDAIRALRDGPAPRYEVCGWQARKGSSIVITWSATDTFDVAGCERLARAHVSKCGGTAHAIYRRVEGA